MRYQYTSSGFNNFYSNKTFSLPGGVKLILILNIIIYILIELSGIKSSFFISYGLVPRLVWNEYKIWQLFTYQFLHGGFLHIFFNMFILWMFGKDLEHQWGKTDFLFFYFICGLGSGAITVLFEFNSFIPIVGASGAIYGLLVAFGFSFPNRLLYLYGLFPIKVKHMVLGLGLISFFASISTNKTNVSHITHLSGMFIGLIFIYYNLRWSEIKRLYYNKKIININKKSSQRKHEQIMRERVDMILDKLKKEGWEGLSKEEINYLNNAAKFFDQHTPN